MATIPYMWIFTFYIFFRKRVHFEFVSSKRVFFIRVCKIFVAHLRYACEPFAFSKTSKQHRTVHRTVDRTVIPNPGMQMSKYIHYKHHEPCTKLCHVRAKDIVSQCFHKPSAPFRYTGIVLVDIPSQSLTTQSENGTDGIGDSFWKPSFLGSMLN